MTNQTPSKTAAPAGAARPARANSTADADGTIGPDLADAIDGAATALAGIADALEHRTAVLPDPLLELLAESAADHADALARALGR